MPTTKNGKTAVHLRGLSRIYRVEHHKGYLTVIEIKPGVRIEDIDTSTIEAPGQYTWEEIYSAQRRYRADEGNFTPGWWVGSLSNPASEPYRTRRAAEAGIRAMLAEHRPHWSDEPAVVVAAKPRTPVTIAVLAEDVFNGGGRNHPFSTLYTCTGPDGRTFSNTSIASLRDVLKRRYGKVTLEVDDQTAKQLAGGKPRRTRPDKPAPAVAAREITDPQQEVVVSVATGAFRETTVIRHADWREREPQQETAPTAAPGATHPSARTAPALDELATATQAARGMNGTGIDKGEKVRGDFTYKVGGETYKRSVVLVVKHAWPMGQPNRTYISDGTNRYVVETDSLVIIA